MQAAGGRGAGSSHGSRPPARAGAALGISLLIALAPAAPSWSLTDDGADTATSTTEDATPPPSGTTPADTTPTTEPAPTDPAPSDPAPSDPAPSDPTPSDPVPSEPSPSDPAPSDPAPSDPTPSDPSPSDPAPPDPTPSDPTPSDPSPSDPAPSDPGPSDPTPSDPTPSDPTPGVPTPGDPTPGHPAPGTPWPTVPGAPVLPPSAPMPVVMEPLRLPPLVAADLAANPLAASRVMMVRSQLSLAVPMVFVLATTDGEGSGDAGGGAAPGGSGSSGGSDSSSSGSSSGSSSSGSSSGSSSSGSSSSGSSSGSNGGGAVHYGGRATGPSPLPLLDADPSITVPAPPENKNLPKELDVQPPVKQANMVCDPVDRPGVLAFADLMAATYDRPSYSTFRSCIDLKSEHYDGRALDWSMNAYDPEDRRIGDSVAQWLTANDGEMAKRFGIQGIIWNAHVWHATYPVWQGYTGQSAHTDHMHFSFSWDGAQMRTSWWTGVAVTEPDLGPCQVVQETYAAVPLGPRYDECSTEQIWASYSGYDRVRPGGTGAGVGLVQPLLDVPQTGVLDDATRAALITWQGKHHVPQTGVLDQLTYAAALGKDLPELPDSAFSVPIEDWATTEFTPYDRLTLTEGDTGPAVKVLQKQVGAKADGVYGPKTQKKLLAFVAKHEQLTGVTEADPLLWHWLEVRDAPTLPYRYIELSRATEAETADADKPVVALLQDHLGVETDGIFGPITEKAVKDAQKAADLEPTGVVDGPTWAAIDKGRGLKKFHQELAAQKLADAAGEAGVEAAEQSDTTASEEKSSEKKSSTGSDSKSDSESDSKNSSKSDTTSSIDEARLER